MADETAVRFAACDRGLVVAPAGCGKTHLIAEAVGCATGRQLVLTHTHAGVAALRRRLSSFGVPGEKCTVTTIDALALLYSNAFPHLADWSCAQPRGEEEWSTLRSAARRLFDCRGPRHVLRASYAGVFVDEYQDCSGNQHAMIKAIADVRPCRVVGDPLQAIYRKLHGKDVVPWADVENSFPVIEALEKRHRWEGTNPQLGNWLADVREKLIRGKPIDLRSADGAVTWVESAEVHAQRGVCYKDLGAGTVVAICDWPKRCAVVASWTKDRYAVLESVECPDLLDAAENISRSSGTERVAYVVRLAQESLTGMSLLDDLLSRMTKEKKYSPRAEDRARVWAAMEKVASTSDLRAVQELMLEIQNLTGSHHYKRLELWREMTRTLRSHPATPEKSLRETAWARRDHGRRNGRRILSVRTIATPLLVKGLEFHHAILLDASQMTTAEELYVALTRASTSLTVLSSQPAIERGLPVWIEESLRTAHADP